MSELHPSVKHVLQFFEYKHLPPALQQVSEPFCGLAHAVALQLEGPEATACLRKLLEAKDCAVRARLSGRAWDPVTNAPVDEFPKRGEGPPVIGGQRPVPLKSSATRQY